MKNSARTKPENTDLERRVLALERVLQSLIARAARDDPAFLDDFAEAFVIPMKMERREHDFVDTDSCAERIICAADMLASLDTDRPDAQGETLPQPVLQPRIVGDGSALLSRLDRVRTMLRNGVWTVLVDGVFAGDYIKREHAEAAASEARRVPR